jgi:hypothetical protein
VKWLALVVIFALLANQRRRPHELSWALVFSYFLIDDALRVHERIGALIASNLDFDGLLGLRAQDFGEFSVSAVAGSILSIGLIAAYFYGAKTFRNMSKDLLVLVGGLVFVGVICDYLDIYLINQGVSWQLSLAVKLLEDGGEMALASVFVAFSYWVLRQTESDQSRLLNFARRNSDAANS